MRRASTWGWTSAGTTAMAAVVALCWLLGPAGGAIVVQPQTTDTTTEETMPPVEIPSYVAPSLEATPDKTKRRPDSSYYPPGPSQSPLPGAAAQQPAPGAAMQPTMPLPPTYGPGLATSGAAGTGAPAMPMAPTAYGLYDSATPMPSQGGTSELGFGLTGPRPSPTGFGFGPPTPTPSSTPMASPGLAVADPRFGPYQPANIEQATAPRPAATFGQARDNVMRQPKPFSDYQKPRVYSPYLSLMRQSDTVRGIDNYYEYVRPVIEQQAQQRQVNREMQGLQETARYDQMLMGSSTRPGTNAPGTSPKQPATFMNFQQYYGGQTTK
ncbi:MAG: hypothetical protein JW809_11250 [Pirellulales bacterium]|nr:hypothetical protein [Pirellulales bacterium]